MKGVAYIMIDSLSHYLKVISDPSRLQMIFILSTHECCQNDLTECFNMSQPAISQHLKKLKEINLITEDKRGYYTYISANKNHKYYPIISYILNTYDGIMDDIEFDCDNTACKC